MRITRALGSLPNLRRHLAPTARSRLSRGRLQGNVSTAIERPTSKGLAQLKLGPASNIVSFTRFLEAHANSYVPDVHADMKNHRHRSEKTTEARIPQALVPRMHAVGKSIDQQFADQRLLSP